MAPPKLAGPSSARVGRTAAGAATVPEKSPTVPSSVPEAAPAAAVESEDDERQQLLRRLLKSEELIRQLKHIVKAQHGKIEELRERLEFDPTGMLRMQFATQDEANERRVGEHNEELRQTVSRLQAEASKMKLENATLRKANRRLRGMVHQLPEQSPSHDRDAADVFSSTSPKRSSQPKAVSLSQESFRELPSTASSSSAPEVPRGKPYASGSASVPVSATSSSRAASARNSKWNPASFETGVNRASSAPVELPAFSKLSRLISVVPMFWRDIESPRAVLQSLIEIAGRLLAEGPPANLTILMVDSWLRSTVTDPANGQPTVFFLGQGKTTLQVFHTDGVRPEPPCFADISSLPSRTRTTIGVPVQMPSSHKRMAVLQAVCPEETKDRRLTVGTPSVLKDVIREASPDSGHRPSGFTNAQLMYLQLVCNLAGGILEQLKRHEENKRVLDSMRHCVDIAVGINKARSLPDFEQRVKHMLGTFFSVNTVRILFFDAEGDELVVSSVQARRGAPLTLGLDQGVVGRCAKRQHMIHVSNISKHPYVDAIADGLQRNGRPVAADAAMLCGPMTVDYDDGGRLIGVVQLLERKKAHKKVVEDEQVDFTDEEQGIFQQLLRVCAHAAWRTYKVQDLTEQLNTGTSVGLARMLTG